MGFPSAAIAALVAIATCASAGDATGSRSAEAGGGLGRSTGPGRHQRPANARLRTLVHEAIHALGVDYQHYPRAHAEVIVDTTTLVVLGGLGLDVSGETVAYVAGWGANGALDAVTEFAQLIDDLARRVEAALSTARDAQQTSGPDSSTGLARKLAQP
jgi:hypothetical protein